MGFDEAQASACAVGKYPCPRTLHALPHLRSLPRGLFFAVAACDRPRVRIDGHPAVAAEETGGPRRVRRREAGAGATAGAGLIVLIVFDPRTGPIVDLVGLVLAHDDNLLPKRFLSFRDEMSQTVSHPRHLLIDISVFFGLGT